MPHPMKRYWRKLYVGLLLALIVFSIWRIVSIVRHRRPVVTIVAERHIALMFGVGIVDHPVSTKNPDAQAYFNQGMALYYGFDKPNAVVSFRKAEEADPNLAMAYWGEACALCRDINYIPGEGERAEGLAAVKLAMKHSPQASPAERDYILALSKRYPVNGKEADADMNQAYSDAMSEVAKRYPDDSDAQVLYAESVMDLHPWKLWTVDGIATPGTEMIVPILESVMKRDSNHLGANHFYVHALEGSPHPEKALAAALLLPKLAPKSPHLMHMPSHTGIDRLLDPENTSITLDALAKVGQNGAKMKGCKGSTSLGGTLRVG